MSRTRAAQEAKTRSRNGRAVDLARAEEPEDAHEMAMSPLLMKHLRWPCQDPSVTSSSRWTRHAAHLDAQPGNRGLCDETVQARVSDSDKIIAAEYEVSSIAKKGDQHDGKKPIVFEGTSRIGWWGSGIGSSGDLRFGQQ